MQYEWNPNFTEQKGLRNKAKTDWTTTQNKDSWKYSSIWMWILTPTLYHWMFMKTLIKKDLTDLGFEGYMSFYCEYFRVYTERERDERSLSEMILCQNILQLINHFIFSGSHIYFKTLSLIDFYMLVHFRTYRCVKNGHLTLEMVLFDQTKGLKQ